MCKVIRASPIYATIHEFLFDGQKSISKQTFHNMFTNLIRKIMCPKLLKVPKDLDE